MLISDGTVSFYLSILEFILFAVTLSQRKKHPSILIAALMIIFLAGYQLCETLMCRFGLAGHLIPYLALLDISFLPPLSLFLAYRFWEVKSNVPYIFFLPIMFFIIFYGIQMENMQIVKCTPFFAMYHYPLGDLYGFFYYAPVILTMIFFGKKIRNEKFTLRRSFAVIILGSYIFISVPVLTAFIAKANGNIVLLSAVESMMCKSASVLAIVLTYVARHIQTDRMWTNEIIEKIGKISDLEI